ncbi:meiotic recombination protein REC8 homolog [Heterodontus francisci]|uniref:meiotic recombination protein REC8 homolog n=1 Tax=Heterodontus francisci TaxID=7792 RepID=UPI00355AF129
MSFLHFNLSCFPSPCRPSTLEPEEKLPTVVEVSEAPEMSPGRAVPFGEMLVTDDYVLDLVRSRLDDTGETDLHTILPTTISRINVCRIFYICLVLAGRQVLTLEQRQPYGRIAIRLGPGFKARL